MRTVARYQEVCPKWGKKVARNYTLTHGVDDGRHDKQCCFEITYGTGNQSPQWSSTVFTVAKQKNMTAVLAVIPDMRKEMAPPTVSSRRPSSG
ncbi:hypothetical protein Tco_0412603 [Tanacetum coccineum]